VQHKLEQIEPVQIHLDSEAKRLKWLDLTINHLVQASGIGPELFVAKGVIPKNLLALSLQFRGQDHFGKWAVRSPDEQADQQNSNQPEHQQCNPSAPRHRVLLEFALPAPACYTTPPATGWPPI
jgi:hypothetical protein